MPFLQEVNRNQYRKNLTGADYNRPSGVLKDEIHVVTAAEEISRIITMPFRFVKNSHELEVYVNGEFKRQNELIGAVYYGDYDEWTNFSVRFNPGVIAEDDIVRFRVTVAYYRTREVAQTVGDLEARVTLLEGEVTTLTGQIAGVSDNITQVAKDAFGTSYVLAGNTSGSIRTIGTIGAGDVTPDLTTYRTWQTANIAPTAFTTFDGCKRDDYRVIIVKDSFTTFNHTATIHMKKGINYVATNGDVLIFIFTGTVWYELGTFRDCNVVRDQLSGVDWNLSGVLYYGDVDITDLNNVQSVAVTCFNNATSRQVIPNYTELTSATNLRVWMPVNTVTLNVVAAG